MINCITILRRIIFISKHQSGFRTVHSTVTALLEATDSWALNIDRGLINAVVFLDLKKAFDTVDHEILLSGSAWEGGPDPAFPLLFHENPASRTFFIAIPNPIFSLPKKKLKKANFCKNL